MIEMLPLIVYPFILKYYLAFMFYGKRAVSLVVTSTVKYSEQLDLCLYCLQVLSGKCHKCVFLLNYPAGV